MDQLAKLDAQVSSIMKQFYSPNYVKAAIHLSLVLYAARLAPEVPDVVSKLFQNPYFRLLVFSLILWTAQISPSTSILMAIAFMVSMNAVNQKPLWEFLDNIVAEPSAPEPSAPEQSAAEQSAPEQSAPEQSAAESGCYPVRRVDIQSVTPYVAGSLADVQ